MIKFLNECEYIVHINLESGETIKVNPHGTAFMKCEKNECLVRIHRNIASFKRKNKYVLVLETKYRMTDICDNDVFRITREKICVEGNVYYDRLFLSTETAGCTMEANRVIGEKELKKVYNKCRMKYKFLGAPFVEPGMTILFVILGIILGYELGWKYVVIYFPAAYFFLIAFDGAIDKIIQFIFKKSFKQKDEKTDFYNYFEDEFIARFYLNLEHTPFMDEL